MAHSEAQFRALNTQQKRPGGSLFLLEPHTGLGWHGNGNAEPRIGVKCPEKFSSSASVWATKPWSSVVRISFAVTGSSVIFTEQVGICWESLPKGLWYICKGGLSPLDCSVMLQWYSGFIKSLGLERRKMWTFRFYITHMNMSWTWDLGKKYISTKAGKCCGDHLSLDRVTQPETEFTCKFEDRMEKRAESTGKVVDKTSPAGARQRLLSRNID